MNPKSKTFFIKQYLFQQNLFILVFRVHFLFQGSFFYIIHIYYLSIYNMSISRNKKTIEYPLSSGDIKKIFNKKIK